MSNVAQKNLVIGAADNYNWQQLKPWATSIKASGFQGDVVLLAYRIAPDVVPNMEQLGIQVYQITHDDEGSLIDHHKGGLPTQTHKLRNFHMWQFLKENDYGMVAVTDTRDVYFQENPDDLLNEFATEFPNMVAVPSENVKFCDEPWNYEMVRKFFGPWVASMVWEKSTCNSGTFFGPAKLMASTMLTMYFIQKGFNATGVDQPTLNFLAYTNPQTYVILDHDSGWACQCGTTLDPNKPHFQTAQITGKPRIEDGKVLTSDGSPFVIVHQYDRVPELAHLGA
jgi:hypothetical protein